MFFFLNSCSDDEVKLHSVNQTTAECNSMNKVVKSIRFTLCFNDCGKGSFELCSETEKQLTWKADVNEIKVVLSPTRLPKT